MLQHRFLVNSKSKFSLIVIATAFLFAGAFFITPVARAESDDIVSLQAQIAALMATITTLQGQTGTPTSPVVVASTTNLAIGTHITTTDNLRIRSEAGINATYIATQPVGAEGVIVAGPVVKDGHHWYKVDYVTDPDGWNIGTWLRTRTDLPDLLGTYISYLDGKQFVRIENISRADALVKCTTSATANPTSVVRCIWRGTEIYVSTLVKPTPRFNGLEYPVESPTATVSAVFDTTIMPKSSVTGPINVGSINWGDKTLVNVNALVTGAQVTVRRTHTYTTNGSFTITLVGLDGKTAVNTVTVTKAVEKPAITALYRSYKNGRLFSQIENLSKADAMATCKKNVAANPTSAFRCVWNDRVIFDTGVIYQNPDIPVRVLSVTNSENPVITGTASGTAVVGISIDNGDKVYGSGDIPVTNGQWSHKVTTDLLTGNYNLVVYAVTSNGLRSEVARQSFAIDLSTTTSATTSPNKNAFGCGRTVTGTFANGFVGCYGMWDYGETFGGDSYLCGDRGAGKIGCMIKTKVCTSGTAKATAYYTGVNLTATKLNTVSARLHTTSTIAKHSIAGLWEYTCVAAPITPLPVTAPNAPDASSTEGAQVLGASTSIYSEISATLQSIIRLLQNLK